MKNLTRTILAFVILISFNKLSAQDPTILWQKSLGGSFGEEPYSIQQTTDGGFITAGYTGSTDGDVSGNHGSSDYWIVKLDMTGNLVWQKCLGGSETDQACDIKQTTDGGYIVAGVTLSADGDVSVSYGHGDYWIVKLDTVGNIAWEKTFGGAEGETPVSIQQTTDGGFIIAGFSNSNDGDVSGHHGSLVYTDYWIVKLDAIGNLVWQKSLGGSDYEYAYSIQQTTDGGFIITGVTNSDDGDISGYHGATDLWTVKLDSIGNITWQKSLGGSESEATSGSTIQQTVDGGYILAGTSYSNDGDVSGNHGQDDYWIVKLDTIGNLVWQKSLGGSYNEETYSIKQTSDQGYIVAGYSQSSDGQVSENHGQTDYWIVKLDTAGNIIWENPLGGFDPDRPSSIQQTTDGNFIIAGNTFSSDGDVLVNHGQTDYWIVKLSCAQLLVYADADSDGFGNADDSILVCTSLAGYVTNNSDCNDTIPMVHPGATEIINGIDDDCDGLTDEICSANFSLYADSLIPHHYWIINSATGIPPLNYYWSWGDSSYDSIAFPGHTYAAAGFYMICLSIHDSTGCSDSVCVNYELMKLEGQNTIISVDVVDSLPGVSINIQDIQVLQEWSVFPNPASGNVFINYSLSAATVISIEVYDVLGKKLQQTVMDKDAGAYHSTIHVQEYPDGIYFLQIRAVDQMVSQKIVLLR